MQKKNWCFSPASQILAAKHEIVVDFKLDWVEKVEKAIEPIGPHACPARFPILLFLCSLVS